MISRRTLLLAPIAAAVPLPDIAPYPFPDGDMVFLIDEKNSVLAAASMMEKWFNNRIIIPDIIGRKVHMYLAPPEPIL